MQQQYILPDDEQDEENDYQEPEIQPHQTDLRQLQEQYQQFDDDAYEDDDQEEDGQAHTDQPILVDYSQNQQVHNSQLQAQIGMANLNHQSLHEPRTDAINIQIHQSHNPNHIIDQKKNLLTYQNPYLASDFSNKRPQSAKVDPNKLKNSIPAQARMYAVKTNNYYMDSGNINMRRRQQNTFARIPGSLKSKACISQISSQVKEADLMAESLGKRTNKSKGKSTSRRNSKTDLVESPTPVNLSYQQDKRELYQAALTLKQQMNQVFQNNLQLKAQMQYMKKELLSRDSMLEKMYENGDVSKNKVNEGSILTIKLKQYVRDLRMELKMKQEEVEHLRKSIRSTRLEEAERALHIAYEEGRRLRSILQLSLQGHNPNQIVLFPSQSLQNVQSLQAQQAAEMHIQVLLQQMEGMNQEREQIIGALQAKDKELTVLRERDLKRKEEEKRNPKDTFREKVAKEQVKQLEKETQKNAELSKELEEMKQKKQQVEDDQLSGNLKLKQMEDLYNEKSKQVEQAQDNLESVKKELQAQEKEGRKQIKEHSQQLNQLKQELHQKDKEIERQHIELQQVVKENNSNQEKQVEQQMNEFNSQKEELNETIAQLQRAVQLKEEQCHVLKNDLEKSEQFKQQLDQENEMMHGKIQELEKRLQENEGDKDDEKYEQEQEMEELIQKEAEISNQLKIKEQELSQKQIETDSLKQQIQQLEEYVDKIDKDNGELQKKNEQLDELIKNLTKQVEDLQQINEENGNEINNQQYELNNEVEEYKQKEQEMQTLLKEKEYQIKQLMEEVESGRSQIEKLEADKEQASQPKKKRKSSHSSSSSSDKRSEKRSKQKKHKECCMQKEGLERELEQLHSLQNETGVNLKKKEEEVNSLFLEIDAQKQKIAILEANIQKIEQAKVKEQEEKLNEEDNEEFEKYSSQQEDEKEENELEDVSKAKHELEQQLNQAQEKQVALNEELKERDQRIAKLEEEKEEMIKVIKFREEAIEEYKKESEINNAQLERESARVDQDGKQYLEQQNESLKEELAEKDKVINEQSSRIQELNLNLQEMQEKNNKISQQETELNSLKSQMEESLKEKDQQLMDYVAQVNQLNTQLDLIKLEQKTSQAQLESTPVKQHRRSKNSSSFKYPYKKDKDEDEEDYGDDIDIGDDGEEDLDLGDYEEDEDDDDLDMKKGKRAVVTQSQQSQIIRLVKAFCESQKIQRKNLTMYVFGVTPAKSISVRELAVLFKSKFQLSSKNALLLSRFLIEDDEEGRKFTDFDPDLSMNPIRIVKILLEYLPEFDFEKDPEARLKKIMQKFILQKLQETGGGSYISQESN